MAGQEDPESRSPARQLVALLVWLRTEKEARDGKKLQLKQIAVAVHRHMKTDETGKWPADRDKQYSVSHLHGVLNAKKPSTPSPSLAYHLACVLDGNEHEADLAAELATQIQIQIRPPAPPRPPGAGRKTAGRPLGPAADAVWRQLQERKRPGQPEPGQSVRAAVEIALSSAVARYATVDGKAALALPLLRPHGFVVSAEVARGLAAVIRDGDLGCAEVFGQRWSEALAATAGGRDLTEDARELLGYVHTEARSLAPLRALGQAGPSAAPGRPPRASLEVPIGPRERLSRLREELAGLAAAASRGLGDTTRDLPPPIRAQLYDQTGLILRSSKGFVGRQFVFTDIDEFIGRERSGYCFVEAHPGVGKTALLSQLLMNKPGYIRHFNVLTGGPTKPGPFLRNVCAQLIGAYRLPYEDLPERAGADNNFLIEVLERSVSANRGGKVVVVIDALDEVKMRGQLSGTNPLYLPRMLPDGCVFVVTFRSDVPGCRPLLDSACPQADLAIHEQDDANMDDIRKFIRPHTAWPGIQGYMGAHGFDTDQFVEHMARMSDGNFMYLHYVLPQIEAGGYLADRDIAQLPAGLNAYYADQLERMKGTDDKAWFSWKQPVITVLARAQEPLTVREIVDQAGVGQPARVVAILTEWLQFLDGAPAVRDGRPVHAYRIFHASFKEFLLREIGGDPDLMDRLHRDARHLFLDHE